MATIHTAGDGGPPQHKREAAERWLGRPAEGGKRLARIFRVGQPARVFELEAELAELRRKLDTLEEALSALRQHPDGAGATREEAPEARLVDLPRVLPPRLRDYQLARCEGFAVFSGARPLGVVKGIRYHSRGDRPDVLEVGSGRLGRRLLLVPVSDVEAIQPNDEAVIVTEAGWPPQPPNRLRAYLERRFALRS